VATLTIYTGGTFDIPHYGHYRLLKKAAKIGHVVVALNTDEFITKYKGSPPIMSYKEREETLLACKWVYAVVPNAGGEDSSITVDRVSPDYIIIGSDWAKKDYYSQMGFTQDWLDERGIGLIYVPYTRGVSTTDIKKRIKER
jgi:glycerol-3-phosphate cytidylyltransferase